MNMIMILVKSQKFNLTYLTSQSNAHIRQQGSNFQSSFGNYILMFDIHEIMFDAHGPFIQFIVDGF